MSLFDDFQESAGPERATITTVAELVCESCGQKTNQWKAETVGPHVAVYCGGCGARYISPSYWLPMRAIKDWR